MRELKLHTRTGPGGWRCPCCGPSPKHRRKELRAAKKSERRAMAQRIEQERIAEAQLIEDDIAELRAYEPNFILDDLMSLGDEPDFFDY